MLKALSSEALVKLAIAFSFLVCYSWFYQMMVRDEKSLERLYTRRTEMMERNLSGLQESEPSPNSN